MKGKTLLAVYCTGALQGLTLVAFPAAATIFTNPMIFGLSSLEYGSLFVPQAIFSILCSLFSAHFSKKFSLKKALLAGLFANLLSMILLTFSAFTAPNFLASYSLLMTGTSCLGIGFGLTVPILNTAAALLRPKEIGSTLLKLNALLGTGTALAPILIGLFIYLGAWWVLPALLVIFLALLTMWSFSLSFPLQQNNKPLRKTSSNQYFYVLATFAFIYGIIETLNGNWATVYMNTVQKADEAAQSLALAAFWTMITVGRVFFAWISPYFKQQLIYQILPFIILIMLGLIGSLSQNHGYLSIAGFGFIGFACSALLPLTISFGETFSKQTSSVTGKIIAFYLCGYGVAAFGVGPLQELFHSSLSQVYSYSAILAVMLIFLSRKIARLLK